MIGFAYLCAQVLDKLVHGLEFYKLEPIELQVMNNLSSAACTVHVEVLISCDKDDNYEK